MNHTPPSTPVHEPGLDTEAADELRAAMRVASSAAQPDRFRLALVVAALVIGMLLGTGLFQRWQFASSLPAFNPRQQLPEPLYATTWYEPHRSMDDILLSLRDMRGR